MPVIFSRPNATIQAPGFDSPAFQINQVINSIEIRLVKNGWPADAVMSASLEYSTDNQQTWNPGGAVTDDATRPTKDTFINCAFSNPLPSGMFWRAHVVTNRDLPSSLTVTVT